MYVVVYLNKIMMIVESMLNQMMTVESIFSIFSPPLLKMGMPLYC